MSAPRAGAPAEAYPLLFEGKVREVREVDAERLLIVASDRISAYDWIMPTPIPGKGAILTALSALWFARTADIVPNHLIERSGERGDAGAAPEHAAGGVRRARLPGRLGLARLRPHRRGVRPPPAGRACARPTACREPIFTPATKATEGHDENITREQAAGLVGAEVLAAARADHAGPLRARRRATARAPA